MTGMLFELKIYTAGVAVWYWKGERNDRRYVAGGSLEFEPMRTLLHRDAGEGC